MASVFVLRVKMREQTPTLPYRCIGYPVVPAVYVLIMGLVVVNMITGKQQTEAIIALTYIGLDPLECLKSQNLILAGGMEKFALSSYSRSRLVLVLGGCLGGV